MLEARDLAVAPPGAASVFAGLNLTLRPGEWVSLTGPNGAGKSTLLAALAGLAAPVSGSVLLDGVPLDHDAPARARIALVGQEPESQFLTPQVATEIAFPLENLGWDRSGIEARVREVAGEAGLTHLLDRSVISLSGGEKARVAVAAALAGRPDYLLLDEPGNYLDAAGRERLRALMRREAERGTGIVWVTQLAEERAAADRCLGLEAGRMTVEPESKPIQSATTFERQANGEGKKRTLLLARNVGFQRSGADAILRDLDVEVRAGDLVLIEGRSGSGKTTLLQLLAGLEVPTRGALDAADVPFGVLLQFPEDQLVGGSVWEDLDLAGKAGEGDKRRALAEVALEGDRVGPLPPSSLSHGERRRVAWAGLQLLGAKVWLLDEPTAGVDEEGIEILRALVERRRADGGGVVIVHQDPRLVSFRGRHCRLEGGRLLSLN